MNRLALILLLALSGAAQATTVQDLCGTTLTVSSNAITCVPVGGSPPTGCVARINGGTSTVALPNSGGSVALTVASCSGTPTYQWTRNGSNINTTVSWSDLLPSNPGTTTQQYAYVVRACNGAACATFPNTALNATVAGGGGGVTCAGFSNVINLTENWANPVRLFSGTMGANDAVVVKITVGNASTPNDNLARIVGAEWQSSPSTRISVLSPKPCDWASPQPFPGAFSNGNTVTVPFAVGTGSNFGYYPIVPLNGTVYFSVKNDPSGTCVGSGICDMAFDMSRPQSAAPQSVTASRFAAPKALNDNCATATAAWVAWLKDAANSRRIGQSWPPPGPPPAVCYQ